MKMGKAAIKSSDIEKGVSSPSDATSDRLESLWDFVPCIIEQDNDATVPYSEVSNVEPEPMPHMMTRQPPSPLEVAQSESFFDDSKPPPMTIAASTSETDEDDEAMITNVDKNDQQLHTDPFAPREGRTLCWRNINMTLVRRFVTVSTAIYEFHQMIC